MNSLTYTIYRPFKVVCERNKRSCMSTSLTTTRRFRL